MIGEQDLPQRNDHEEYEILMMGYIDGELAPSLQDRFKTHMQDCTQCAQELVRYQELTQVAHSIRLREPQDVELERFWENIYNRMERHSAWGLIAAGVSLPVVALVLAVIQTDLLAWWLKAGIGAVAVGFLLLFISVLRERMRTMPYDRYRGVKR